MSGGPYREVPEPTATWNKEEASIGRFRPGIVRQVAMIRRGPINQSPVVFHESRAVVESILVEPPKHWDRDRLLGVDLLVTTAHTLAFPLVYAIDAFLRREKHGFVELLSVPVYVDRAQFLWIRSGPGSPEGCIFELYGLEETDVMP